MSQFRRPHSRRVQFLWLAGLALGIVGGALAAVTLAQIDPRPAATAG